MKVKRLIEKLKKLPPEMQVYIPIGEVDFPEYKQVINVDMEEMSDLNKDDTESVVIVIT